MIVSPVLGRALLGTVAAAAGFGLAACGSVTPSARAAAPAGSPKGPGAGAVPAVAAAPVCADTSRITALTIRRVSSLPGNHLHFGFPAVTRLDNPAKARTVAARLCSLPGLPRVMVNCPADFGVTYRLRFAADGRSYQPVTAAPGGCHKLAGLDGARQALPAFWASLGAAMGLAHPGIRVFAGLPPS
ncbi:MAG: hypothetical protein LBI49_17760 [Nocardiopsaceae bacterium]|jgi:hypothetical protein|nr:hypothetical protein [Nocardiopsaceae bacterium]